MYEKVLCSAMKVPLQREVRRLLSIDKFKAIELVNAEFKRTKLQETLDQTLELLAGRTLLFPQALREIQRNGRMSESILRLCYLFAKRKDVEFVSNRFLKELPNTDFADLEYCYWTRRHRLDLSAPHRKVLSDKPALHAEHFKALIQLKLFREALQYYVQYGDLFMNSSELFAFWIQKVLLYQPGAYYELKNILWEMQQRDLILEHDDIQHIYTSWLRFHRIFVYRKYFLDYDGIGSILGLASSSSATMEFRFHRKYKMDTPKATTKESTDVWSELQLPQMTESTHYDITPLLGFYNWMKTVVPDHALIRDAMMTVHVQLHDRMEHQQIAEGLYSYWNDSGLDPIMRILFQKTGQTIKLSAFLQSSPTPNHHLIK
jgi:hypothetical protein